MLIDSHAHLTDSTILAGVSALIARAKEAGVEKILNIATNPQELEAGYILSETYPWIYQAGSTTPHDAENEGESTFSYFEKAAYSGRLKAVGETGLDYYYFASTKEQQKKLLIRYLELARQSSLPVVIHCREAFSDLFEILDKYYTHEGKHLPGVLHCFTGTAEEAKEVILRGWYLSLSGIVTYKKSQALREIAATIPLDRLLIETDTPYLAPQAKRGQTNEPAFLVETAQMIASLKNIPFKILAESTAQNACSLFKI